MIVETPQLVHHYQVFLRWWYPFFFRGPSQVAGGFEAHSWVLYRS